MRRGREPQWVYLPNGDLAGIALGSDFCSEHEWGVKDLRRSFGCDESKDGIARRQVTLIPKNLRNFSGVADHPSDKRKKGDAYDAIFLSPNDYGRTPEQWVNHYELSRRNEKTGIGVAWDEKSFGIVAYGEKDKKNLALLWDAFQRKDIAFYPQVGVFHLGGGLIFCIISKVPEKDVKEMLAQDLDYKELLRQSAATGIEEELKAAGKGWFALQPKWAKEIKDTKDGKVRTTFPVIYFLNPRDQDQNNSGWYTVEQLKLWIEGKGPVAMTAEERRAYRSRR
jgi:hypothetical protein